MLPLHLALSLTQSPFLSTAFTVAIAPAQVVDEREITLSQERLSTQTLTPYAIAPPEVELRSLDFSVLTPDVDSEIEERSLEFSQSQPEQTLTAQSSARGQRAIVDFFINEEPQEQIVILRSTDSASVLFIESQPFLELTAEVLRFDLQEKLELAVDAAGFISIDALRQAGLEIVFDDRKLELYLRIAQAQRKTNIDNLRDGGLPPEAQTALKPSKVSGFLNFRGTQEIIWSGQPSQTLGRQPLQLGLEGAVNFKGWVLEGSGDFTEDATPTWKRNDLRLVRDVPTQALRYVIGDLTVPVTGYQSSRPMGGIAISRNFSLQPYRLVRPLSRQQFILQRPSRVEVFRNGALVRTLQLPAGVQDIQNLVLSEGINNVQLIITDDLGRVQRLDLSTGLARNLLRPGLEQFAYSVGFPSTTTRDGTYDYDWDSPILTAAHRWGISDNLTMGGYFQGDFEQQLLGWEGILATAYGNLEWDVALSHGSKVNTDYAFKLRYDYIKSGNNNPTQRQLGFTVDYRGANFTTLERFAALNDRSFAFELDYRQKLFWDIFGNLNASYSIGRDPTPNFYRVNVGLPKFFRNGLNVNFNLSQSRDSRGRDEQRGFLSLSLLLPKQRQTVTATTNVNSNSQPSYQLNWSRNASVFTGGVDTFFRLSRTPINDNFNTRFRYRGYRGNLDLSHDVRIPPIRSLNTSHTTRLNFETAIVFADGVFGWSRPVTNSFVIVVPDQQLQGQVIGINPILNSYTARIDSIGAAVVPELQAYQLSTLRVVAPDLPKGYGLSQELYRVLLSYKSGRLIQLQSIVPITLKGVLLNPDQSPVASQRGAIVSLVGTGLQPIMFSTDESGQFSVDGLKPGRYEIRLFTEQEETAQINIPEGQTGAYDLGTLNVSPSSLE